VSFRRAQDSPTIVSNVTTETYKPPYAFSTHIGTTCNQQSRTFVDLAAKLKMDVTDLMRQCNGQVAPSRSVVKGLAKELKMDESYLNRLAEEVRKDLGLPNLPEETFSAF
jgi:hypothetical protein